MFPIHTENSIKTKKRKFITNTQFEQAWHEEESHHWQHLPLNEIFLIKRIDIDKNLIITDKDKNQFHIRFIPHEIFLNLPKALGMNLLKDVYFQKRLVSK